MSTARQPQHREPPSTTDRPLIEVFERLVRVAADHKALTGQYLQIWGELGELYAQVKLGVKRHPPHTSGSDGTLGDELVEVKTISPEKAAACVHVKRAGNFGKLLIVKISANFEFDARMVDRRALGTGTGKRARWSWRSSA